MPKRQVLVESITECYVEKAGHFEVHIKIWDENIATVNLTSKNNPGGEAWEWAQGHWPEFIPEHKEVVLPTSSGKTAKIKGKVRWVCVTGILDPKTRKSLPIEELRAGDASNRRYGAFKKGKKVSPVKEQGTPPSKKQKTGLKTSPKGKSLPKSQDKLGSEEVGELGSVDLQEMVDERLRQVLEEEN